MMKKILKLPVVVMAMFATVMFILDGLKLGVNVDYLRQPVLPLALFVFSLLIVVISGYSFFKAKTTPSPITPEKATTLVTTGLYSVTRNPMYAGSVVLLVACAILIGNIVNLLLLPIYIILVNKLYIIPEEKALEMLFKDEFVAYTTRVRRWI